MRTNRLAALVAAASMAVVAGCGNGGRTVDLPSAEQAPRPGFVTRPDDLADSPQLESLVARDTAGLPATTEPAAGSLLPDAIAALAGIDNPPTALTRLSIYDDSVYFSFDENGVAGRSVTAVYRIPSDFEADQTPVLDISDPTFGDDADYPISVVDASVPAELGAALGERYPLAAVRSFDLDVSRSFGFGLVWSVDLDDARGHLATVFADLDGSIVAVDDE